MFVILQEPLKSETFETFAINISSQDAIGIEKTGNQFGLGCVYILTSDPVLVRLRWFCKDLSESAEDNLMFIDFPAILMMKCKHYLVILKHFDAHFSNQSTIHWCICRYDTYQDCLNLMNLLLEGLVSGATCFDLRQAEKSVLQNENLPKV